MNTFELNDKPQPLAPRTLFEKVWGQHVVAEPAGEPTLLYIDLQLVHEVTSPQAFDGLRLAGRALRNPARHIATVDHNVPTTSAADRLVIADQVSAAQVNALRKNCAEFGIEFFDVQDRSQGIVHMIGPELGATKPGMTIVCGDSHTSTHGAFGALAFGIGTSEVEHVMATQTLKAPKPKTFRINVEGAPAGTSQPEGALPHGVTAKDIILEIIGQIGTDGATGYAIEYAGSAIRALSMEGRMTVCNMSIEAGARAGMIAPDDTTFAYLKGRRFSPGTQPSGSSSRSTLPLSSLGTSTLSFRSAAEESASVTTTPPGAPSSPTGLSSFKGGSTQHQQASSTHPAQDIAPSAAPDQWSGLDEAGNQTPILDEAAWTLAVQQWCALVTDADATFDRELTINATALAPRVTWGTSPGMVTSIEGRVPTLDDALSDADRKSFERAFDYMGLTPGTPMEQVKVDAVFLGSCTNGRIEDLRAAARIVRGRHIATTVRAMVVPGSQAVKRQAEDEGLDQVFLRAGFEWREPGCSMCLGMNPDILQPGERCASTSNRNFEGRQGRGGRTHLLSPEMAAAAAITGHLTDVRKWQFDETTAPTSLQPEPDFHLDLTAGGSL